MEALKAALQDGRSTLEWSIVHTVLEQQVAHGAISSPPEEAGPRLHLDSAGLWKQFFTITNEMIVTKAGRRMFPVLKLHISGLEPSAMYAVVLEFRCTHQHRWRFLNGSWQKGSSSEDNAEQRHMFVHFSSIAAGSQWMQEPVSFAKLKLSNKENGASKIRLNSLHKYQPYIHLVKMNPDPSRHLQIKSFTFPETQFITVTAYQNDKVTQMKIKNNPFAKAFLGGNSSERIHNSCLVDVFPHQHNSIVRLPSLLPFSHPHNHTPPLGISPPPYPGSLSPLPPGIFPQTPSEGFQDSSHPPPQIQNQEHTPPLMTHGHLMYHDYQGFSEVYDADTTTCTQPQTYLYDYCCTDNTYLTPDFCLDYFAEPSLLFPCDNAIKPITTIPTPSTNSITSAPDDCYYRPFQGT